MYNMKNDVSDDEILSSIHYKVEYNYTSDLWEVKEFNPLLKEYTIIDMYALKQFANNRVRDILNSMKTIKENGHVKRSDNTWASFVDDLKMKGFA